MSRLFISHSSKDNVAAKAFKQWLDGSGWPDDDVFLDLDDIGAGERWKDALRKASARCEAVVLLASPDALSSPECLAELRKAEDYGKEIIVVLLRDVQFDDHRLDSFKDRQIVNLASPPQSHVETVHYRGDEFKVSFNAEALASVKEYLFKRGITPDRFPWPPRGPARRGTVSGTDGVYRIRCRHILWPRHRHFARSRQAENHASRRASASAGDPGRFRRRKVVLSSRREFGHGLNAMPIFFPSRYCGRRRVFSPDPTASAASSRPCCRSRRGRSIPAISMPSSWPPIRPSPRRHLRN